ncbi:MAG TPA: hypothetical protein VEB40_00790, partial [Flavipsychrobacter sp.]|nr:hypothetical protein [Flavipsychrobacter sp.]
VPVKVSVRQLQVRRKHLRSNNRATAGSAEVQRGGVARVSVNAGIRTFFDYLILKTKWQKDNLLQRPLLRNVS